MSRVRLTNDQTPVWCNAPDGQNRTAATATLRDSPSACRGGHPRRSCDRLGVMALSLMGANPGDLRVPARAPHHDEPGNAVLSRRAMTEDKDSWLELLEIRDADAAVWELVVACPQCRMWQA